VVAGRRGEGTVDRGRCPGPGPERDTKPEWDTEYWRERGAWYSPCIFPENRLLFPVAAAVHRTGTAAVGRRVSETFRVASAPVPVNRPGQRPRISRCHRLRGPRRRETPFDEEPPMVLFVFSYPDSRRAARCQGRNFDTVPTSCASRHSKVTRVFVRVFLRVQDCDRVRVRELATVSTSRVRVRVRDRWPGPDPGPERDRALGTVLTNLLVSVSVTGSASVTVSVSGTGTGTVSGAGSVTGTQYRTVFLQIFRKLLYHIDGGQRT